MKLIYTNKYLINQLISEMCSFSRLIEKRIKSILPKIDFEARRWYQMLFM